MNTPTPTQHTPVLDANDIKVAEVEIVTSPALREIDIMLDMETLGTKPGCKILTIGATTFNVGPVTNQTRFECAIRVDTQDLLKADPNTVDWWAKQSPEARKAAFENVNAVRLTRALILFSDWIDSLNCIPVIWCNGAPFDAPVLEYAYDIYNTTVPWDFRKVRCYRTLKALFGHLIVEPEFTGVKHNALADAVHQAKYAEMLMSVLPLECKP